MNIFPDTECYSINFWPGTSGNFLYTLLNLNINSDYPYTISKHGNMHEEYSLKEKNIKKVEYNESFTINQSFIQPVPSQFLTREPIDPSIPILYKDHQTPDFALFHKKFPKGKIIIIQYDDDDREHIACNSFYKIFVDEWYNNSYSMIWENVSGKFFNGEETPFALSEESVTKYIQAQGKLVCIGYPYSTGTLDITDIRYYGQLEIYSFKDLLFDRNKTLSFIQRITSRNLTQAVTECYDRYIEVNYTLLKKFPNLFQNRYQPLYLK